MHRRLYSPAQVTVHDIPLTGLAPGTLYFYRVTSCNKRGCATASGSFDTFPSCPDVVPPISGSWQRQLSPNVSCALRSRTSAERSTLSSTDAWVVGWAQDPNGPPYLKRTLTEHFDGNTWSIVTSPNVPNDTQSVLYSVSGSSANDVWAVGATHNGTLPVGP